jgi:hypothetical protein
MLYQVVFTGALRSDVGVEQAVRDFADVFKVPADKAAKLVAEGRAQVLKRDVDEANATRYRDILEEIGLVVRIEPTGTAGEATDPLGGAPAEEAPPHRPAESEQARSVADAFGIGREPRRAPQAAPRPAGRDAPPAERDASVRVRVFSADEPRRLSAGHGWQWIRCGMEHLKRAPGQWIAAVALLISITLLLVLIPLIGGVASALVSPILLGGLMSGAHRQRGGEPFRALAVLEGFSGHGRTLAAVGGLYLLGSLLVSILLVGVLGLLFGDLMLDSGGSTVTDAEALAQQLGPSILLALLLAVALSSPLLMAYWLAPALVVLKGLRAWEAMKLSFRASLKNLLPLTVYGLGALLLGFLVLLPMALIAGLLSGVAGGALAFLSVVAPLAAMLLISPILIGSMYCAYRDIFIVDERA